MPTVSHPKSKILLVDDNELYRDTLEEIFADTYLIQTAVDGETALQSVATSPPDLILLDINMPGIDGHEVCRRLKANASTQDIPIIFLTSFGEDEDQTRGLALGAVDYIVKPSDFSLIRQRIQTHLELKFHRDHLQQRVNEKERQLVKAHQKEREKDLLMQKVLMSVPVAISFIVDRKIVWCNRYTTHLTGYRCDELMGQSTRILYPSDEVYQQLSTHYLEIQNGGTSVFNSVWHTKNNEDIKINVHAAALDKNNLSAGVIFAVDDVTDDKVSLLRLAKSEQLYRELFKHMSSGVAVYRPSEDDQDFFIADLNVAASTSSCVELSAVKGKEVTEIFPGVKEIGLLDIFRRVSATGIAEKLPTSFYQDQRLCQFVDNYVFKLPDGHIVAIYDDVTEQREYENRLVRAKEEWETTFNAMTDMVTIHDGNMHVVQANQAAYDFWNIDADLLIGKKCCEVFWHSGDTCFGCPLLKTMQDGQEHSETLTYDIPGKVLLVTTIPLPIKEGQPNYYIHVAKDITEQQQLQDEVNRANRLASLGELAAGVAHEINNPNALILYNSEILEMIIKDLIPQLEETPLASQIQLGGLPYAEAVHEVTTLLPTIHASAQRIKRIVSELRDFSHADQREQNEWIDLNRVVEAAVHLTNSTIKKSTHCFEVTFDETLPQIMGVTGRLEQVVINLLINACQALENPTQKLSISTAYDLESKQVQLFVIDEGCGMTPDILEHILEPFVTTKREQGGTGLGLSVSAKIVNEHCGQLKYTSSPGAGTTAILSLPATMEDLNVN